MLRLRESVTALRQLCKKYNVHTIQSLEGFCYLGQGLSLAEIQHLTGQFATCIHSQVNWLEIAGLIERGEYVRGKSRTVTFTPHGEDFIKELNQLLCK